jgi:hypothetical protein
MSSGLHCAGWHLQAVSRLLIGNHFKERPPFSWRPLSWCFAPSPIQSQVSDPNVIRWAASAREPAVKVSVGTSRDKMTAKPILLWPKPRSDIALHLDREADDFLVVDTNYPYELQKLYKLRREIPIFDPFPHYGEHYRDFSEHVLASDCRYYIVGLNACQELLRALKDPSLAHSSIEELLTATKLDCNVPSSTIIKRSQKISIDWSYLNWPNISVSAILVFVATLVGNVLSLNNSLIAAIVATLLFATLYTCVRTNFLELLSSMWRRMA